MLAGPVGSQYNTQNVHNTMQNYSSFKRQLKYIKSQMCPTQSHSWDEWTDRIVSKVIKAIKKKKWKF